MSKTVEERIVSMQFDNKQFERNVSTTMSTLDKLKKSLKLEDSAKGFDKINDAAKKFDVSPLSNGIESVKAKFSALEIMGITCLANITNSAFEAGKKLISAFTIDPIKSGFQEYETQINAVQTILANTSRDGTTLDQVNNALDTLNTYADKTIYNFTEMTRNIGTFTAAGLDLDSSVKGIQGIANLAAVSGSTSQQASTAMYQLSQALSAGTVQLMDWNSVVNAGMGGKVFQDAIIQTGKEMGALDASMIKAYEDGASFRSLLDNASGYGKWFTSDILSTTLSKFTKTGVVEYMAEFAGVTKEEMQALQDLGDQTNYNSEEFDKMALSLANGDAEFAENIKSTLKMATTAEDAATKVKTFSQLMDTLKEAAQSGWTQTWEILVGDFEEAKYVFTSISDVVSDLINKSAESRNNILEGAFGSKWGQFSKIIEDTGVPLDAFKEKLTDTARENGVAIDDLVQKYGSLEAVINKGKISSDIFKNTIMSFTGASNENGKATEEQIDLYKELERQAEATGIPLDALLEKMNRPTGRELIIESFSNAFKGLKKIIKPVADAYNEIFNPKSDAEKAEGLYGIITAINEFSKKLIITDGTAKKVERTFKGIFAVLNLLRMVLGGGLYIAFKIVSEILGIFNMNIWDLTAIVGDAAVAVRDFIKEHDILGAALKFIVPLIVDAATAIANWAANSKILQNAISSVTGFLRKSKDTISEWINSFNGAESIPEHIISGLKNGIINRLPGLVSAALEIGRAILDTVKNFLGIHSPSKEFESVGEFSMEGLIKGILKMLSKLKESAGDIGSTLIDSFKNIDWNKTFAVILSGGMVAGVIKLAKAFEAFSKPAEGIGDVLSGTGKVLSGFGKVLRKSARSISKVIKSFSKVLTGFSKVLKGLAFDLKAKAFLKIAIALAILVAAIALLTFVDQEKLKSAAVTIVVLAGVLTALAIVLSKMSGDLISIGENGAKVSSVIPNLLGIGIAIMLIAGAIKIIGGMKPEQFKQGMLGLAAIIAGFAVIIGTFGLLCKGKASKNISKVGGMMIKLSLAMLLMIGVIKLISMLSTTEIVKGVVAMAFFTIFVGALMEVVGKKGKNADKVGSFMIKLSIALLAMAGVVKIIGGMSWGELIKGGIGIVAFTLIVKSLIKMVKKYDKDVPKIGACLLAISTSLLIMAGVVKIIGGMSWGELARGIVGIATLTLIIKSLIKIVNKYDKDAPKIAGTILALSIAIGILAGVTVILSLIDLPSLLKGVVFVGILGVILSKMIEATKDANNCMGNIIAMTVAISLMAVAVGILSFLDPTKLGIATLAMTILMGMFALIVKVAGDAQGSLSTLVTMTVAVGLLGGMLVILAQLPWQKTLGAAAGLAIVLLSFAVAMKIISSCDSISTSVLVSLGLMVLVVGALALLIGALTDIDTSNIMNIAGPLVLLAGVMAILAIGVNAMTGAIAGAAALLIVTAALVIFIPSLIQLSQLSLGEIGIALLALAGTFTVLGIAGLLLAPIAPIILILAGAITLIGAGAFLAGAGCLMFGQGLALISQNAVGAASAIGEAIPTFLASLAEFAVNAVSTMFEIGSNLVSAIGEKAGEFLEKGKEIMGKLKDGIGAKLSSVRDKAAEAAVKAASAIKNKLEDFKTKGKEIMNKLKDGINSKKSAVIDKAKDVASKAVDGLNSKLKSFKDVGKNLIEGLREGIKGAASKVVDSVKGVAQDAIDGAKALLGIHSPSRVFAEIGKFTDEGFVVGLEKYAGKVKNASANVGQKAVDGISDAISGIGNIADMDATPTIRPVLDMGSVDSRNLQLSANLTTLIAKPVDSLSNLMVDTQNEINASNNRVISAINGLRDDFAAFADMDDTEIGFYVDGKKLASSLARPMNRELSILARRGGI